MEMSRRKQLHPKSLKEADSILFTLPKELKYDEKSNEILTQINLPKDYSFGPYPANLQIEDQIESFQLLDNKHNWLASCSKLKNSSGNLNLNFQNNQLFLFIKESIAIGTQLYSNQIILPKIKMNEDIQIKQEPNDIQDQNTFHRKEKTNSINTIGVKRKSTDNISSTKRLLADTYCSECDIQFTKSDNLIQHKLYYCRTRNIPNPPISFNHPVQIGQYIYVPIPVISSSQIENKPLDLTKPKENEKIYSCHFCSVRFQSLKTLHAHQENYCLQYQKETNQSLFICRLCKYHTNTLHGIHRHLKYHLLNNEPCSISDIIKSDLLFRCTICSSMFNSEEILLNHIKNLHTNEILIECLQCRSRFCSKWNLLRHMKLLHTNIKSDDDDDDLNEHLSKIQKKFSCSFCHIKFGQIETLKQHMKTYCSYRPRRKKKEEENRTFCSSCQISFQQQNSYQIHQMFYCPNRTQRHEKILV